MDLRRSKWAAYTVVCFLLWATELQAQPSLADSIVATKDFREVFTKEQVDQARKEVVFIRKEEAEKQAKEEIDIDVNDSTILPKNEWWKSRFFQLVVILVVAAVLFWLVSRLLLGRTTRDDKMHAELAYTVKSIEEDLLNSDPQAALQLLLDAGNYTLATRMLFLGLLKNMHEKHLIEWKKDKTNRHFLSEMFSHASYPSFRDLVDAYELVWYGERALQHEQFAQLRHMFDAFKKELER